MLNSNFTFVASVLGVTVLLLSCVKQPASKAKFLGTQHVYSCDKSIYSSDFQRGLLVLTELNEPQSEKTVYFLVSDTLDKEDRAGLVFLVDRQTHRVDQVRTVLGEPFQYGLQTSKVTSEVARARVTLEFAKLVLEDAATAGLKSVNRLSGKAAAAGFVFRDLNLVATEFLTNTDKHYGPLATKIMRQANGKLTAVCTLQGY